MRPNIFRECWTSVPTSTNTIPWNRPGNSLVGNCLKWCRLVTNFLEINSAETEKNLTLLCLSFNCWKHFWQKSDYIVLTFCWMFEQFLAKILARFLVPHRINCGNLIISSGNHIIYLFYIWERPCARLSPLQPAPSRWRHNRLEDEPVCVARAFADHLRVCWDRRNGRLQKANADHQWQSVGLY